MNNGYAEHFGDGQEAIKCYVDILLDRGIVWGLLGPREADRIWQRHVLNSVAFADLIPEGACVVDVGSGAGLPGIPLAVFRPDLKITLLEPLARRSAFLELAVAELDLGDRVSVVRGRAEQHDGRYDMVISRAVAPLGRLLGWCVPLMGSGGRVLALKGSGVVDEVRDSAELIAKLRLRTEVSERATPVIGDSTWALVAQRL